MTILSLDEKTEQNIIKQAIKILESGGLVVYPTETCYGLAADATNQEAINKLLSYKRRREGKPLSVLVDSKKTAINMWKLTNLLLGCTNGFCLVP